MKSEKKQSSTERLEYEKGFEDGYAVAVRLYKPIGINYITEEVGNHNKYLYEKKRRDKKD